MATGTVEKKKIDLIHCSICGAHHYADAGTFIVLRGNITKGLKDPLVGNKLKSGGVIGEPTVICLGNCVSRNITSRLKYDTPPPPPPVGLPANIKFFNGGQKAKKASTKRRAGVQIIGSITVT